MAPILFRLVHHNDVGDAMIRAMHNADPEKHTRNFPTMNTDHGLSRFQDDLANAVNIQSLKRGILIEQQNGNAIVYWQMWGLQPAQRAVYLSMENQKEIEPRSEVPDHDYDEVARLAFSHPAFSGLYRSPLD